LEDGAVKAVFLAARGGLAGRRLQALIIFLVVLASTATSVVALGLLANAHGPFDRAFGAQRGADVTAAVDTAVASPADMGRTGRLPGVTAFAGPLPLVSVTAAVVEPGVPGTFSVPLRIAGRSSPGGPVDDLTLDSGHWPDSPGQIVAARGTGVFQGSTVTVGSRKLAVVGVAESVTRSADAWVLPGTARLLTDGHGQAEMLYRFSSAGSASSVASDITAVRAVLPPGSVLNAVSYLSLRQAEEGSVAPWVPFIVAFGVIALVISVLIVVNVVSGAVLAGTVRIGVLKSIGFTPAQVVASYVLLVAVPSLLGCAVGAAGGNLLAMPMLAVNARVYSVGTLHVPLWVNLLVPLSALAATAAAAVPPALRAGKLSVVAAIAAGRAPATGSRGYFAHRLLGRLSSVPRPVTLGLASPFARPGRTLVTAAAIVFGAAAVTFGAGLAMSLNRVASDNPTAALPVQVSLNTTGPQGAAAMTAAERRAVLSALTAQPGTLHAVPESDAQLSLPGAADAVSITAYGGAPAWTRLPLITGRWYSGPAQADVNTLFLTDTGTTVGSSYTMLSGDHRVTVRIVGEVFGPGKELRMYASPATLAALSPGGAAPGQYDVALRPGVSVQAYAIAVSAALGKSYSVSVYGGASGEIVAVTTLIAMLMTLIAAVAGLGVVNTVALQIRERARDIGVFKALGMTPRQTLSMIVCSVALVGLVGGIIAVPAGVYLHHGVVPVMAHAANSGYPPSMISVYAAWELVAFGLAGLAIAVLGALGPATWAARARTAFALRTE
jgi:putative ABC transport system permease protein